MDQYLAPPWILVATPQMTDPNFDKSVVLIVEDSDEGTMGFIVNKPMESSLGELVEVPDTPIPDELLAWYGGPVDTTTGIIVHNQNSESEDVVLDQGVILSSSRQTLVRMVKSANASASFVRGGGDRGSAGAETLQSGCPYRFMVGYAGWGPGQLAEELRTGTWIQAPMDEEIIFHTPWQDMWTKALGLVGVQPEVLVTTHQPYLN